MTLAGTLIAEGLRVGSVLEDIALTVAKILRADLGDVAAGQPRTWAFVEFDVADEDAERSSARGSDLVEQDRHPVLAVAFP